MTSTTTISFTGPRSDFDYSIYLSKAASFEHDVLRDHIRKYKEAVENCVFEADTVYTLNSEMRNTVSTLKQYKKHESNDFLQVVSDSYQELLTKYWTCKNEQNGLSDFEWSADDDSKLQAFAFFAYTARQAYKTHKSYTLPTIHEEPSQPASPPAHRPHRSPSVQRSAGSIKTNLTKAELLLQQSVARSSRMFKAYTPIPEDLIDDEELDGSDLLDRLDLEDTDDQTDLLFGKIKSDNTKYINYYRRYGRSSSQQ